MRKCVTEDSTVATSSMDGSLQSSYSTTLLDRSQRSMGSPDISNRRSCMTTRTLKESLQNERSKQQADVIAHRRQLRLMRIKNNREHQGDSSDDKLSFSVSFDSVEIREYPIILGDNPSVLKGPPCTIDWKHFDEDSFVLDEYESTHPQRRKYREMVMPHDLRENLIKRSGKASSKEIRERIREMDKVKSERLETRNMFYRQKSEEKMERFSRGLKNLMSTKKKKEKDFLLVGKKLTEMQRAELDEANRLEDLKIMNSSYSNDSNVSIAT